MGDPTPHIRVIHCIWTLEGLGAFNLNVSGSCGNVVSAEGHLTSGGGWWWVEGWGVQPAPPGQ